MKKILCIGLALLLCLSSLSAIEFSAPEEIRDMLDNYAGNIVETIPTSISVDNIWGDAWIGNLLAIPPHFAIGINTGSAFIKDNDVLDGLSELTGISQLSMLPGAPVPTASVQARIGGIILPFDIGLHLFVIPEITSNNNKLNGSLSFNSWGADFRYCLLKQILVIPAISVGIGYDEVNTKGKLTYTAEFAGINKDVGFDFGVKTKLLSGTAEVSWNLLFLKLFAGARAIKPLEAITAEANVFVDNNPLGTPIMYTNNDMTIHLFGGIGFRLLVIDLTIGANYEVTNGNLGLSFSTRFQL